MIEERGGRFRVRIWVDGDRKDVGSFDTRAEAEANQAVAYAELGAAGGKTLASWGAAWLDQRETDGVRAIRADRGRWKTHVASSPLAARPLAMLTPKDITAWITKLRAKTTATPHRKPRPLAAKTIKEVVGLLKQCLEDAIDVHIASNPAAGPARELRTVMKRRAARESTVEPWTYLDVAEQRRLLSCEQIPEEHRLAIGFALYAGLRQGEQHQLELVDVHLDDPHPHVFVRWGGHGKPTKGGRPRRVYLLAPTKLILERWLAMLPGWAPKNPDGLVFPNASGSRVRYGKTMLHTSTWNPKQKKSARVDPFRAHLRAARITRHVRWHDLRHSCASSLIAGWWGRRWTLEEVREYLGHTSIQSTIRYAHLGDTAIKTAVAATLVGAVETAPLASKTVETSLVNHRNQSVGRQGLEPWTYGLKARGEDE